MKPLLKWAGGKSKIAERLATHMAPFGDRYVEPFFGSGAMFLHLSERGLLPGLAILADRNPRLMNFHEVVQREPGGLLEELAKLPRDASFKDTYLSVRSAFNDDAPFGSTQAARLLWLNKSCFNGLYRENRSGGFNVPVGSYASLSLPDEAHVRQASRLLVTSLLKRASFEQILDSCGEGDVVYCDPPYLPSDEMVTAFSSYDAGGFGLEQHRSLARAASAAARRGARVFVSNHDTALSRSIYASFVVLDSFGVQRSIGRTSSSRVKAAEALFRATV